MLMAKSRHRSLQTLQRYARPGPAAVADMTARNDPDARRIAEEILMRYANRHEARHRLQGALRDAVAEVNGEPSGPHHRDLDELAGPLMTSLSGCSS
jgi:hypothetical protein